ncbi:ROK family protein [Flavihumibacter sp. UBA7668]|uniref:ROK family protein n=1 Tax=Flavihumibacter sp. UBA7668 TaxID=1946542 RepID=UPI0025BCFBD0|nr:ROK family protein [Flavihumibacter sp. UBA7668]
MRNKRIGIDIGGTGIKAAQVEEGQVLNKLEWPVLASGTKEEVVDQVNQLIRSIGVEGVSGIGIGVPGLVNPRTGIVYDVMNIPAWKKLDLKTILENEFHIPVALNNDANCFALGVYQQRKIKERTSLLGVTIGTGLGTGIILDGKLVSGLHGGAGEFGLIEYRNHDQEYYASGRFFENIYNENGKRMYELALAGDPAALKMYAELGMHIGNAFKTMLYALDINYFIIGGSVAAAWPMFREATLQQLSSFAYSQAVENLVIEISDTADAGIIGASALIMQ